MGPLIIEYQGRKVLYTHSSKVNFIAIASKELMNHGIVVPEGECRLEVYHKELDMYYSIMENDVPDSGLIKLIWDCDSGEGTSSNEPKPSTSSLIAPTLQPISTSSSTTSALQPTSMYAEGGRDHTEEGCSQINEFAEFGVHNWPKEFKIIEERIPGTLLTFLKSKALPERKNRSAILEFLYEEMTRYTYYPTPRNYDEVAAVLLKKFPHLKECSSFGDAKELWKIRLSTKARNSRKRKDRSQPVVVKMREKPPTPVPGSGAIQLAKSKPAYGAPNYLPKKPDSEDDASVDRHINFLKCESAKTHGKDSRKIELSMKQTFHHRRDLIVRHNITVSALRETYPTLFDATQLCYEFTRITEIDIITAMRANLLEYAEGILEVSSTPYELNTSIALDDQRELLACTAVGRIPALMKENVDFTAVPEVLSPMVVFDSATLLPNTTGRIIAEGEEVCIFEGPIMGMAVWLAAYYCFDCCYPKSCCKTLRFLQRGLLGLKDSTKTPLTIMMAFNKVKLAQERKLANTSEGGEVR